MGPLEARMKFLWSAVLITTVACHKEIDDWPLPPITDYRTYDWVTVAVKEDPFSGGFVLLCKDYPADRRTSCLQLLGETGEPGARIRFDQWPDLIGVVQFDNDRILYTDFLPLEGGRFFVAGMGRMTNSGQMHLIARFTDSQGGLDTSYSIPANPDVTYPAQDADLFEDAHGLPRERVLCGRPEQSEIVAALRWESNSGATIRTFSCQADGSSGPTAWLGNSDITSVDQTKRMYLLTCDPASQRTLLVSDVEIDERVRIKEGEEVPLGNPWTDEWPLGTTGTNAQPEQVMVEDGVVIIAGWLDGSTEAETKAFLFRKDMEGADEGDLRVLNGIGNGAQPVSSYCFGYWEGTVHIVAHVQEAGGPRPYFQTDLSSDMVIVDLDADLNIVSTETIVAKQGLRAIGYFKRNGRRVIIGSQHPFLNATYQHTFLIALD